MTKAKGPNPKDLQGVKKPPLHLVPNSAVALMSLAMYDGAGKYDPFNWRDKDVLASIYVAACKRHLDLWWDGQELSSDVGVPNLGAALACIAIIVDAQYSDCLIDDRPIPCDLEAIYKMAEPILASLKKQHDAARGKSEDKIAAAGTAKLKGLMAKPSVERGPKPGDANDAANEMTS